MGCTVQDCLPRRKAISSSRSVGGRPSNEDEKGAGSIIDLVVGVETTPLVLTSTTGEGRGTVTSGSVGEEQEKNSVGSLQVTSIETRYS